MSDQPGSPKPANTQSIDDKITSESIRRLSYENPSFMYGNQSLLDKATEWISKHKIPVVAALVVAVLFVSVGAFAIQGSQKDDSKVAANDGPSVTESDNYDAHSGINSENGSGSNSGVGDLESDGKIPAAPETLIVSPGSTVINASWQKVSNATQYVLEIDSDPAMKSSRAVTSGINSATIVGLKPMTKYHVRVMAINAAGKSPWSFKRSITTKAYSLTESITPLPSQINSLNVSVLSTNSVSITWKSASNASRYTVRKASNSGMTTSRKEYAATTSNTYRVSDLSPGSAYYFTVQASNIRGFGPTSRAVYAKTRVAVPSIVNLSLLSNNTIRTTIKASAGATSHELQHSSSKSFSGARTMRASTTTTLTGLKPATTYYIQTRAKDGGYASPWSPVRSIHTTTHAPKTLRVSDVTKTSAKVTWSRSDGSRKYEIRYSKNSNFSGSNTRSTQDQSITLSRLAPDQRYHVQVRTFDGVRWTGWSSRLIITTERSAIARTVRIAQANLYVGMSASNFSADLNSVMDLGPDFITLNETYKRSDGEMQKRGYLSWRSTATRDAKETPVLWRNDRWAVTGKGTKAISRSGVKGGTRDANYVTLKNRNNGLRKVTIVSVHLIQQPTAHPSRAQVMRESIGNLNVLIREKSKDSVVLIGGDFNMPYVVDARDKQDGFPYKGLKNTNTISTYESLGIPNNNASKIDYIFFTRNPDIQPLRHWTKSLRSDHPGLIADFRFID